MDRLALTNRIKPNQGRFTNVRMPLAYTEWRNDGAPLVILIHGNRDHSRSWDAVAHVLHRRYHVVAPDLRGHGDSGWAQDGRYDFAAYLADLVSLCEALAVGPGRPAILIGHSLGAHIALRLAAIYPEWISRMVTIEAVGAPPEIERRRATQTADDRMRNWFAERRAASMAPIREFSSVQQAVERMKGRHPFLSPAQALHLTRHGLRQAGKAAWRWKHDPYVAVWAFPDIAADEVEALWSRIACPTLLLGGERSWPSAVPAQLLRTIPDAQQVKLAQSGHWPHHDALDACLAAILKFIPPTL